VGLLMAGYVLLYLFRSLVPVFMGTLIMLCGYLSGTAVFGAMVRDHTPENKAGMFQGLRIIGQVLIPGVIGPAIGAWLLRNAETMVNTDGTTSFIPNESIFIGALVAAGVVWLALSPLFFKKKEV
jgi:MFS family permease